MNEAIWEVDSVLVRLGRLTSFNALTDSGRVRGNRSFTKRNGCYHFGGSSLWTHRDVLEYLVVELLNQGNQAPTNSRPFWTISGQPEILNDMTLPIACGEVMTARRLLDAILAPCFGRDAVILPTELGYELSVFSLLTETIVAGGYTLPENPYQYDISLTAAYDVVARFEWCTAQLFDRIVVQGAPIVIVLSFGAGAPGGNNCRAGWSAALETAYQAAAGADPDINDDFRTSDKFRDVYQLFLVTGAWQSTPRQWVMCALDGTLVTTNAPYQRQLRRSRPELPLRAGYDYTTSPPTWVGDPDVIPEELPPLAWVLCSDTGRYVLVDLLHIADKRPAVVHALRDDWGIRLRSAPNHAYALNHWTGANQTNFIPDGSSAVDYAGLGFTIAIESDHRVRVGADLPAGEQFGCGLVQVIEVPDALLHVLAPQTVVGTSATGALAKSPDALVVLRDDRETLKATLAGAIGRYERWRCRASLNYAQLNAGSLSLGAVLRSVDIGGLTRNVAAVLSSCVWDFDARRTMLSAGQAER